MDHTQQRVKCIVWPVNIEVEKGSGPNIGGKYVARMARQRTSAGFIFLLCSKPGLPMASRQGFCCVHQKSRSMDVLTELEPGIYRCNPDSKCRIGRGDYFDPKMCCVHQKRRAPEFLVEIESGIFRCSQEDPCKVGAGGVRRAEDSRDSKRRRTEDGGYGRGGGGGSGSYPGASGSYPGASGSYPGASGSFPDAANLTDQQRAYLYQEGLRMMAMATGAPLAQMMPGYGAGGGYDSRDSRDSRRDYREDRDRDRSRGTWGSGGGGGGAGGDTAICFVHDKRRSRRWLEEVSPGKFRCTRDEPCKVGGGQKRERERSRSRSRSAERNKYSAGQIRERSRSAERDKYSAERDKYSAERDRYSTERDKYSPERDKYSPERDKYYD